jgi:hypothetical protein
MRTYYWLLLLVLLTNACGKKESTISETTDSTSASKEPMVTEGTGDRDSEDILRERNNEEEKVYSQLGKYDGVYSIHTESEGVSASLKLEYKGDRVFSFELSLEVADVCSGYIQDKFTMDRTQHGFYDHEGCLLHFNLLETEVEIDEPAGCSFMKGECTFSSTWIQQRKRRD